MTIRGGVKMFAVCTQLGFGIHKWLFRHIDLTKIFSVDTVFLLIRSLVLMLTFCRKLSSYLLGQKFPDDSAFIFAITLVPAARASRAAREHPYSTMYFQWTRNMLIRSRFVLQSLLMEKKVTLCILIRCARGKWSPSCRRYFKTLRLPKNRCFLL